MPKVSKKARDLSQNSQAKLKYGGVRSSSNLVSNANSLANSQRNIRAEENKSQKSMKDAYLNKVSTSESKKQSITRISHGSNIGSGLVNLGAQKK